MLVTHKDDPAYIRQQVDEMYKDFGKAVNNSGSFIKDGFDKIERLVNDKLLNKNEKLASILLEWISYWALPLKCSRWRWISCR